jgi:hypothetical protein
VLTISLFIVGTHGIGGRSSYEAAKDNMQSILNKLQNDEHIKQGEKVTPIAIINGINVYQEDVDATKTYSVLSENIELDDSGALIETAKRTLMLNEASEAGFVVTESEYAEILKIENDRYDKSIENEKFAKETGLSRDEIVLVTAHIHAEVRILSNYYVQIFSSLYTGEMISDNKEINEILERYKDFEKADHDNFRSDMLRLIDLYIEDQFAKAELIVF